MLARQRRPPRTAACARPRRPTLRKARMGTGKDQTSVLGVHPAPCMESVSPSHTLLGMHIVSQLHVPPTRRASKYSSWEAPYSAARRTAPAAAGAEAAAARAAADQPGAAAEAGAQEAAPPHAGDAAALGHPPGGQEQRPPGRAGVVRQGRGRRCACHAFLRGCCTHHADEASYDRGAAEGAPVMQSYMVVAPTMQMRRRTTGARPKVHLSCIPTRSLHPPCKGGVQFRSNPGSEWSSVKALPGRSQHPITAGCVVSVLHWGQH